MSEKTLERIEALEAHLAHTEKEIEDMNQVVLIQREEITRITRRLDKLMGRVDTLEDLAPGPEAHKPPHY
ncbi:SlyX family protein [Maricaulis parjimensis]|uniref:SlyX family protein n=1 Tax=Maricaulis parjimensis TaxID=144023 RepID=UPI0019399EFA|nr:SlyX family protein [Maricaulis parjimensis]